MRVPIASVPFVVAAALASCGTDRSAGPDLAAVESAAGAPAETVTAAGLRFVVPAGWRAEEPTSSMRQAQLLLPSAGPDGERPVLVVYYFGAGSGGGVEANLDRWCGQFETDDGRPGREAATIETRTVNGLDVTTVDLGGRYVAETAPGSGVRLDEADHRLKAAIVATPRGHFFLKLVGPEETIGRHGAEFDALVESLSFGGS